MTNKVQPSRKSCPTIKTGDRGWFWHPEIGPVACQIFSKTSETKILVHWKHPDKKDNLLFELPINRFTPMEKK